MFSRDPAIIPRDSKGRFATPERAYADKALKENRRLRSECERFKRSYYAAADLAALWQRKYQELQEKIKSIINPNPTKLC
jgi:phage shock protein A